MPATPSPSAKPSLLLFEQRMIGDAVMSLPFIRSAAAQYDVHVTCAHHSAEIFRMVLPADRVIPWTPPWIAPTTNSRGLAKWRNAGIPAIVRRLKAIRPQVAASVWADSRTHILMALTGAKTRAGFPMSANNFYASHLPWRQRQIKIGKLLNLAGSIATARPLLTHKANRTHYYQHHVDDFRDLAAVLDIPWDETQPWLPNFSQAEEKYSEAESDEVIKSHEVTWLIHPGARFPARQWPITDFARIIRELLAPAGIRTLFIRPPELDPAALPELPPDTEIISPATLPEFLAVCARADVLLCNDTGVSHMGAALGKRVIAIFTNQEPRWFAPRGSEADAISADVCPVRPCLDRCTMPSYICLQAITYAVVRQKVLSTLARPH